MNEKNPYNSIKNEHNKTEKNKKTHKKFWIFLGIFLILILAGFSVGSYVQTNIHQFSENFVINTVNVSGMTTQQASEAVYACIQKQAAALWTFQRGNDIFPVEAKQLMFLPESAENIVSQAWEDNKKIPFLKRAFSGDKLEKQNYEIPIAYNTEAQQQLAAQWHEKWNQAPVDATLSFNGSSFQVIPAQDGYTVHEEEVFSQLPSYYSDIEVMTLEIPLQVQKAEITEESWQNIGRLSSYSTRYNPGEVNRTHNMSLAVKKVNGTILKPGENFFFNQKVGVRSAAAGYKDAQVIANGAYKPELGGGICQVTSTLYNGVLLAGLQIVERHNHALDVSYVPSGRDATVYYGSQDFGFKNSNKNPIYIGMSLWGGTVNVSIYGNLEEKKKIDISTVLDETVPYTTEYQEDTSLTSEKVIQNGMNGKVVRSFRNYLDASGNVVRQEALGKSYYQPMKRIIARPPENAAEDMPKENKAGHEEIPQNEPVPEIPEDSQEPDGSDFDSHQKDAAVEEPVPETLPEEETPSMGFDPNVDPFGNTMP